MTKLFNYQKAFFDQMNQGFSRGELVTIAARGIGKTRLTQETWYGIFQEGPVLEMIKVTEDQNGIKWYNIGCRSDVAQWIRGQPQELWVAAHDTDNQSWFRYRFKLHEELYTMALLRWLK